MTDHKPRLLIADDHRLVVDGLKKMLGTRFEVVGVAYTGMELLELLKTTTADGLLLDLSLPDRSGLALLPDVFGIQPGIRVLVLTMHVDRILVDASLAAGALGFVPKDSGSAEVEIALTEVLAGRRYVSPRIPKTSHKVGLAAVQLSLSHLTARQQEILHLLGRGRSSRDIAKLLGLSTSAVTWHRAKIRKALGLRNEWELARHSILVHLAGPEQVDETG